LGDTRRPSAAYVPARSVPGRTPKLTASTSRGIEQGPLSYALRQHRGGYYSDRWTRILHAVHGMHARYASASLAVWVPQRTGPLLVLEEIGELAGAHLPGLGTGGGRVSSELGEPLIDRRV
jgi:hypothetical protein